MHASARPYAIAGSALLTSGMIAVMPAVQPAALRVANMDVRLVDVATDVTSALGSIDPLTSLGGLSLPDLGSLDLGSLFADGSLLNIPYNVFADIVNSIGRDAGNVRAALASLRTLAGGSFAALDAMRRAEVATAIRSRYRKRSKRASNQR